MKCVFLEHKPRLGTKAYVIITRSVGFGQMDFVSNRKFSTLRHFKVSQMNALMSQMNLSSQGPEAKEPIKKKNFAALTNQKINRTVAFLDIAFECVSYLNE